MPRLILLLISTVLGSGLSYNYFFAEEALETYTVSFKITNIRHADKGNFVLCFFANQQEFNDEAESIRYEVKKEDIKDKEISFTLQLPKGKYGAIVLDDENKNDEMDFKLFLPKEGFGFTNFYPLFRPKFKNFQFEVPNTGDPVVVKLRYFL